VESHQFVVRKLSLTLTTELLSGVPLCKWDENIILVKPQGFRLNEVLDQNVCRVVYKFTYTILILIKPPSRTVVYTIFCIPIYQEADTRTNGYDIIFDSLEQMDVYKKLKIIIIIVYVCL